MNRTGLHLPEGRAGQASAVALSLLVALMLWLGLVAPALGWFDARQDALATARLQVAHMAMLQASLPGLRRQALDDGAAAAAARTLLAGNSDTVAGANLQSAVQGLATAAGTDLDSAEITAATPAGTLRRIGVAVTVTATWPVLTALLTAIDVSQPRMMVDDLAITALTQPDGQQDAPLQASFSVSAFRAGDAP